MASLDSKKRKLELKMAEKKKKAKEREIKIDTKYVEVVKKMKEIFPNQEAIDKFKEQVSILHKWVTCSDAKFGTESWILYTPNDLDPFTGMQEVICHLSKSINDEQPNPSFEGELSSEGEDEDKE